MTSAPPSPLAGGTASHSSLPGALGMTLSSDMRVIKLTYGLAPLVTVGATVSPKGTRGMAFRSASAISRAVANRSSGRLLSERRTMSSTSTGIVGLTERGGGGGSWVCRRMASVSDLISKGTRPLVSS